MKILMVSDFYHPILGGMETHVRTLSTQLKTRGHEIMVVTTSSPRAGLDCVDGIDVLRLNHTLSNFKRIFSDELYRFLPPLPDLPILHNLKKVVQEFQPDIIHAHGWIMYTVALLKQEYSRIPMVATLHDCGFICPRRTAYADQFVGMCPRIKGGQPPSLISCIPCCRSMYGGFKGFSAALALRLSRSLLRNLDFLIPVCNYFTQLTKSVDIPNVRVIPNFTDPIKTKLDSQEYASETGNADIIYVGPLSSAKGAHVLLASYKDLQNRRSNVHLTLIARSIGSKIRFPRNVKCLTDIPHEQVLAHIDKSEIVVVPSLCPEALSSVALEAMALSKPVIASEIGGNVEIVKDKETGFLVPPGDHKKLAEAILFLLDEPELRQKMGINAFDRLMKCFSADVVVPKIENLYKEAISLARASFEIKKDK